MHYSIREEKAIINAELNSALMFQFLLGIYTGVYVLTVFIYRNYQPESGSTRKFIVNGSLSVLYGTALLSGCLNWWSAASLFCDFGESRTSIFTEALLQTAIPAGVRVLEVASENIAFLFADGLLLWRCFHVCGRSTYKMAIPTILFAGECALAIAYTVALGLFYENTAYRTTQWSVKADIIHASLSLTVVFTSLAATALICHQIYSKTSTKHHSWKRYRRILDALIQSSVIYSSVSVITATTDLLDFTARGLSFVKAFILGNYAQALLTIVTRLNVLCIITALLQGLAPTLMVARLALSSDSTDEELSSVHLPSELFPDELFTKRSSLSYEESTIQNNADTEEVTASETGAVTVSTNEVAAELMASLVTAGAVCEIGKTVVGNPDACDGETVTGEVATPSAGTVKVNVTTSVKTRKGPLLDTAELVAGSGAWEEIAELEGNTADPVGPTLKALEDAALPVMTLKEPVEAALPVAMLNELDATALPVAIPRELDGAALPVAIPRELDGAALPVAIPRELDGAALPVAIPRELDGAALPVAIPIEVDAIWDEMGTPIDGEEETPLVRQRT
ncbi:hypothetical protein CPC08DRAFT_755429 [Agrocybe pediades]|nr:hypothetical protein CPC08DRAFT_755429 [Agrocybe pediades]